MSFYFSPKIVTDGLIHYFDTANINSYISGSTSINDISKLNIGGTLINGPTYTSSNGGGLVLDGINDYIFIGTNQNYYFNLTKPFTLSIWLKANTLKNSGLFNRFNAGVLGNHFLWTLSDGTIMFHREITPFNLFSVNKILPGIPYNIVATYNGTTKKIYINGNFDNSLNSGNIVQNQSSLNLYIGCTQSFGGLINFFNGTIYNTKIYNRALSDIEILLNYNVLKTRFGL